MQSLFGTATAIIAVILAAYFTRINEKKKLRLDAEERARRVKAAIASEIDANLGLALGDELKQTLWVLQRRKDKRRLNYQISIDRSVYDAHLGEIGNLQPEVASQIIYFYGRLKLLVSKFEQIEAVFENELSTTEDSQRDPYSYVDKITDMVEDTREAGIALMRKLNDDRAIGEYDVSYRIDALDEAQASARIWENERQFRASSGRKSSFFVWLRRMFLLK